MTVELSVVNLTVLCIMTSTVSLYCNFSLKIAGLVQYAKGKGKHKFH